MFLWFGFDSRVTRKYAHTNTETLRCVEDKKGKVIPSKLGLGTKKRGEQKVDHPAIIDEIMVGGTGFEPVTSTVWVCLDLIT